MTDETRDLSALVRQIENLDIEVSRSADGVLTVCSSSEPFFCYDAISNEEISTLVSDTIVSYAKHFFNADLPRPSTEATPIESEHLPVDHSTPVSRLKPVFDLAA